MVLTRRGDHLVVEYGNGQSDRHSRVVEEEPDSVLRDLRVVTKSGAAYLTGWVRRLEGSGQLERFAWPDQR